MAGAWSTDLGSGPQALPEYLPAWDLSSELRIRRRIDIDVGALRDEVGLPVGAAIAVTVGFSTSRLDGRLMRQEITGPEDVVPVDINVVLEGRLLSMSVELVTGVILTQNLTPGSTPAAWRRGSVLWQDMRRVRLHGDATQFPMEVVDFEVGGLDPAAPWFVQLESDLALPLMGSAQLLINARFPLVVGALQRADSKDPLEEAVRSALKADVGRTLIEHLLALDDEHQDWPEDSLGSTLRALLTTQHGTDVTTARGRRDSDAARWASGNASAFGLLRGVEA